MLCLRRQVYRGSEGTLDVFIDEGGQERTPSVDAPRSSALSNTNIRPWTRHTHVLTPTLFFVKTQGPDSKGGGGAQGSKDALASGLGGEQGRGGGETPSPESPIEYTDASGKLKFNKRRTTNPATGGGGASAAGKGDEGSRDKKKAKAKRAKLAKLNNAKLLSFGSDEDG